jgi:hypothetical protein
MIEPVDVLRWAPEAQMTWEPCGSISPNGERPLAIAVTQLADRPGIYRARPVEATAEPWHFFYVDETGKARDSGAASHIF